MREDVTYVASSLIGEDLADHGLRLESRENKPWMVGDVVLKSATSVSLMWQNNDFVGKLWYLHGWYTGDVMVCHWAIHLSIVFWSQVFEDLR